jgi:hypothetical protein
MDGFVGEDDHRVDRPLAAAVSVEGEVVHGAADRRIEVRERGPGEGDAERVASGPREGVAVVAADPHGRARDARRLRREPGLGPRPLARGKGLPGGRAVAPYGERHDDRREHAADEPRHRPPGALGTGRRRQEVDAVLVLDELTEAEVSVLGAGRRPQRGRPRPLAPPARDELDLGREQHDDGQPDGDPRAQVVAEEPRDDEDESGGADGRLNRPAIDLVPHGPRVRVACLAASRVAPCRRRSWTARRWRSGSAAT